MGQYYKPAILGKNKKTVLKWMYSHRYGEFSKNFCGLKLMEHSWMKNKFVGAFESMLIGNPQIVVWAGDYADACKGRKSNVYDRCKEANEVLPSVVAPQVVKAQYIVNHTTKQFVDKSKVPSSDGWRIHPLPLLCASGNGRGGGDFCGKDEQHLVGSWARNLISVESKKPEGYAELIFDLME